MAPSIFSIFDIIKGIFSGEYTSFFDFLSIPEDLFENQFEELFSLFARVFDFVKPLFQEAGKIFYDMFKIESLDDVESAFFLMFGIATFLLLVKLVLWFLGG